jgi:protein ImuB
MARIVSLWLPRWPIQRYLIAQARKAPPRGGIDPRRPFILVVDAAGGPCIAALNTAAERNGLRLQDKAADARAKVAGLQVRALNPPADQAALRRLARWAGRYTPAVSVWGEENGADGLFLDVTGAAHLFGGEAELLDDIAHRLNGFRLSARLAIADTPGMAWALSHFHALSVVILPSGEERASLAGLPIDALRVSTDTRAALHRLGFKRAGALLDKPRAPFAARFPAELLTRIDQALGAVPEPLVYLAPVPAYRALRQLLEPIATQDAIVTVVSWLMQDLVPALIRDGVGAKALQLALYRIDGEVVTLDLKLAAPTRDPAHVARLIHLQLERIVETIDAGFGFETLSLTVTVAEKMEARQTELGPASESDKAEALIALIDRLRQRLGPSSVHQLGPVESHLPERAETACAPTAKPVPWPTPDKLRPILLLQQAEPAEVMALVPEGPPKRFRWRGMTHSVLNAQGPERIACEWWRTGVLPTRDYYVVENEAGARFWLYREGIYERETTAPRWFVHGLFA